MKGIFALIFYLLFAASLQSQVLFTIQDVTFQQGDTVRAEYVASSFEGIGSFQFAMKHDTGALRFSHLEFNGEIPSLGVGDFSWHGLPGYNLQPGELRCVWSNPYGSTVADNTHIFSVVFVAKTSGSLSSGFWVWENHPILKPNAYKAIPLQSVGLDIAYIDESGGLTSTNDVAQSPITVFPNPFADSFNVSLPGDVHTLRLYNSQGALMWEVNTECSTLARFDTSPEMPTGLYVLEGIGSNAVRHTAKLIKN